MTPVIVYDTTCSTGIMAIRETLYML